MLSFIKSKYNAKRHDVTPEETGRANPNKGNDRGIAARFSHVIFLKQADTLKQCQQLLQMYLAALDK